MISLLGGKMRKAFMILNVVFFCSCISCQTQEKFVGKWELGDPMIFHDSIYDEKATKYKGLQIEYEEDGIFIEQKVFPITKKQQVKWDSIDLKNETKNSSFNGLTFNDLEIKHDSILVYTFKTDMRVSLPGFFIFLIDDSNMITMIRGVYYKMKRVE